MCEEERAGFFASEKKKPKYWPISKWVNSFPIIKSFLKYIKHDPVSSSNLRGLLRGRVSTHYVFLFSVAQLVTQRALKTWTWTQCACASSVSSIGRTAGRTASAQWCRSQSMTRVRLCWMQHCSQIQPSEAKCILSFTATDACLLIVFFTRGHNYITTEDQLFEPEPRSLYWQDRNLYAVWQSAER